jgi:CopC domain
LNGGIYKVNWRAVSSDTHKVEGSFNFRVDTQCFGAKPDVVGTRKTSDELVITGRIAHSVVSIFE